MMLIDRCDGAVPPGRRARFSRDVLTKAEQETALLVVAGRSNKNIAEQLCLSVRTVEGRLQRLYLKLGVNNREQLRTKLDAVQI